MRIILLFLLLSVVLHGEDWVVNGRTYKDVQVLKVEADCVTISHKTGGGRLDLAALPPALQKRFGYDPAKAGVAAIARTAEEQNNLAAIAKERKQYTEKQIALAEQHERPAQETWSQTMAIKKDDKAHGYCHSVGHVLQVLPDGIIVSSIMTTWGIYGNAYVKCDPTNVIDDQNWTGVIIPQGTYHYVAVTGAAMTIPAFTTDLREKPTTPIVSNYRLPRAPVSSMTSVGGG